MWIRSDVRQKMALYEHFLWKTNQRMWRKKFSRNESFSKMKKRAIFKCERNQCIFSFLKPCCHIPSMHALTALRCVFEVLTLVDKLSSSKTQQIGKNACGNEEWQLALRKTFSNFFQTLKQFNQSDKMSIVLKS